MTYKVKARYLGQITLRAGLPLGVFTICVYWLTPHLTQNLFASFPSQLADIHWAAWTAAFALTAISLWTVGRYDGVAHQHFATRVPQHQARAAGTISITLAQTLGFGVFTGALARWRMLPDVSLTTSLKLSAFVSVSFMLCWAFVTAITCLVFPAPHWTFIPSVLTLCATPIALIAVFRWPTIHLKRHQFHFPNFKSSAAILFWTVIDTTAVAGAMFVLLPSGTDISFTVFLPLFLLALGTALMSNTPGGVGPFELMMLGLLSQFPAGEVLGSIVAFRIVYYAVPALAAFLALLRPFRNSCPHNALENAPLNSTGQAEVQVIAQNGGRLLPTANGSCAIWPTSQTLTTLCNPLSGDMATTINALNAEAALLGKHPFVYKCSGKNAVTLRENNWSMIHMSDDAIISPQTFTLGQPALRTLRRKLRTAQKSGVIIKTDTAYPWLDMERIDGEWQKAHGAARGGTMGRFEVGYLSNHFIARAEHHGRICAFVTFQVGTNEWCLDVIRHTNEVPDGTMHALVHEAIKAAQNAGVPRLSLASTPACPDPHSHFFRWAARQAVVKAGGTGLRQFKSNFAPNWEPRYAAAPTPLALVIGLADITREVHHPGPIHKTNPRKIHNFDEYYELVSKQAS
jgi:phosphatidylglycerol lysyltransferase|tara:strand:- start:11524 stop:13410 length:1887 start_codon:yes stop_codon:yes gene_type:complete